MQLLLLGADYNSFRPETQGEKSMTGFTGFFRMNKIYHVNPVNPVILSKNFFRNKNL